MESRNLFAFSVAEHMLEVIQDVTYSKDRNKNLQKDGKYSDVQRIDKQLPQNGKKEGSCDNADCEMHSEGSLSSVPYQPTGNHECNGKQSKLTAPSCKKISETHGKAIQGEQDNSSVAHHNNQLCDLSNEVNFAINTTALAARRALLFGTSNTLFEKATATAANMRCVANNADNNANNAHNDETINSINVAHNKCTGVIEKERPHDVIHVEPHVDAWFTQRTQSKSTSPSPFANERSPSIMSECVGMSIGSFQKDANNTNKDNYMTTLSRFTTSTSTDKQTCFDSTPKRMIEVNKSEQIDSTVNPSLSETELIRISRTTSSSSEESESLRSSYSSLLTRENETSKSNHTNIEKQSTKRHAEELGKIITRNAIANAQSSATRIKHKCASKKDNDDEEEEVVEKDDIDELDLPYYLHSSHSVNCNSQKTNTLSNVSEITSTPHWEEILDLSGIAAKDGCTLKEEYDIYSNTYDEDNNNCLSTSENRNADITHRNITRCNSNYSNRERKVVRHTIWNVLEAYCNAESAQAMCNSDNSKKAARTNSVEQSTESEINHKKQKSNSGRIESTVSTSHFHALTVLILRHNHLHMLEDHALPLTLVKLDISCNHLTTLHGVERCTHLELLNARRNNLTEITHVANLTKLTHLFVGRNEIRVIDNMSHLRQLHTLDVSFNALSSTSSIRTLSLIVNLRFLYIKGNPLITKVLKQNRYKAHLRQLCPSLYCIDDVYMAASWFTSSTPSHSHLSTSSPIHEEEEESSTLTSRAAINALSKQSMTYEEAQMRKRANNTTQVSAHKLNKPTSRTSLTQMQSSKLIEQNNSDDKNTKGIAPGDRGDGILNNSKKSISVCSSANNSVDEILKRYRPKKLHQQTNKITYKVNKAFELKKANSLAKLQEEQIEQEQEQEEQEQEEKHFKWDEGKSIYRQNEHLYSKKQNGNNVIKFNVPSADNDSLLCVNWINKKECEQQQPQRFTLMEERADATAESNLMERCPAHLQHEKNDQAKELLTSTMNNMNVEEDKNNKTICKTKQERKIPITWLLSDALMKTDNVKAKPLKGITLPMEGKDSNVDYDSNSSFSRDYNYSRTFNDPLENIRQSYEKQSDSYYEKNVNINKEPYNKMRSDSISINNNTERSPNNIWASVNTESTRKQHNRTLISPAISENEEH